MVSCFVTHGVFPKESWRRFLGQDGAPPLFEKAWFTGSNPNPNPNPTPSQVKSPAQLEALWREMQPGRRMELRVSPRGDRLFVIEPQP